MLRHRAKSVENLGNPFHTPSCNICKQFVKYFYKYRNIGYLVDVTIPVTENKKPMNVTKTAMVELSKQDLNEAIEAYLHAKGIPSTVKKLQYDSTLKTVLVEATETDG